MMSTVPHPFSLSHFISSIPLPEDEKAARYHYLSYCYGKGKVLGEYYTSLIADYFGLGADKSINIIQRLSSYLRAYTIVDDDLRDTPQRETDKAWVLLRSFFLEQSRQEILFLSAEGINASSILESELAIYHYTSEVYSKRHAEGNPKEANDSYTDGYADRMATIRVPFRILGMRAQNQELAIEGCQGINSLIKSLQLLDDLVDWKEDLAAGRLTYPLLYYTATLSTGMKREKIYPAELMQQSSRGFLAKRPQNALLYNLVTRKQLELTVATLNTAATHLARGVGSGLSDYANSIRQRVSWVLSPNEKKGLHQNNLLIRVKRSGAAPRRSFQEKGFSDEYRSA